MRSELPLLAGALVSLVVPLLAQQGQDTSQAPTRLPRVRVGVPEGRQGGVSRRCGPGRERQAGPTQPAPRNSAGRVVLGGATPAPGNGVWLPGGGGPVTYATLSSINS